MPRPRPRQAGGDTAREEQPAPGASQCFLELTSSHSVIADMLPPIEEHDGCGADDLVRVHAVVLQQANRVALNPAPTLRCRLAIELGKWIRQDLAAEVVPLGAKLAEIENDGSYECRSRNNVADAPISEHASANAIDLHSFTLTDGKRYAFTDALVNEAVRQSIKASACARFTTVLGPGSDGYHEQHIHLDVKERRNGYRICQWDVRLPDVPRHGADDH
ncbi:MAG: extensin family protein [Xanthobacteraceae bacterium]|nr:extensin family protein [Xanthobacteraceae bacterium]MBV9631939.1 extensin family protein [Xanthobacteraceae bacterium]